VNAKAARLPHSSTIQDHLNHTSVDQFFQMKK